MNRKPKDIKDSNLRKQLFYKSPLNNQLLQKMLLMLNLESQD